MSDEPAPMPDRIFGIGYRRLPGDRPPLWAPWPIARTALVLAWRKRSVKLAFAICAMSVMGHGMVMVLQIMAQNLAALGSGRGGEMAQMVMRSVVGDVHTVLATFISTQTIVSALLLATSSAGLIADDRRTGALELYFSRPLRRQDYVVGKLLATGLVPLATMVVPFVLLWLLAVGLAPPVVAGPLTSLLLPGVLGTLLAATLLTTTMLGLSAVGERGRTVGVIYVVVTLVLSSIGEQLPRTGQAWAGYLSPLRNVQTVADAALDAGSTGVLMNMLYGRPETNPSVWLALACVLGLSAVGLGLVLWRVRSEVSG